MWVPVLRTSWPTVGWIGKKGRWRLRRRTTLWRNPMAPPVLFPTATGKPRMIL